MRISLFYSALLLSSLVMGQTFVSPMKEFFVSSSQLESLCPNSKIDVYWDDAIYSLVVNKKKSRYYINATVLKEKDCNSIKITTISDVVLNQKKERQFVELEPLCDIMAFKDGLVRIQKSGACLVRLNEKLYYFLIDENFGVKQGVLDFDFRI